MMHTAEGKAEILATAARLRALDDVRRDFLRLAIDEAIAHDVSTIAVLTGYIQGQVTPGFEERIDKFVATIGLPRTVLMDLANDLVTGEPTQADLLELLKQYPTITDARAHELINFARRLQRAVHRYEKRLEHARELVV